MKGLIKKDRIGLKLILTIILIATVIIFVSYFIWSWSQLNKQNVPLSDIEQLYYASNDNQFKLWFVGDRFVVYETTDNRYVFDKKSLIYNDGIIELKSNDNRFIFGVLSDNRLYNNAYNVVLYGL